MHSPSREDPNSHKIRCASAQVSISPWVNERFPSWEQLLSAHDVARLVRRPRWMLPGLVLLRGLPRRHLYHGRRIGWLRSELISWLARDLHTAPCVATTRSAKRAIQLELPPRRCALRHDRSRRRRCQNRMYR